MPPCSLYPCLCFQDNPTEDSSLTSMKRLSKSNIDLSGVAEDEEPRQLAQRKQSDCCGYDCDAVTQHKAFLSR